MHATGQCVGYNVLEPWKYLP